MKIIGSTILKGHNFTFAMPSLVDKNLLLEGFQKLSSISRYYRFHSSKAKLSKEDINYFLDIDNYNHFAIGAIEKIKNREYGIGLIRYIRDKDAPSVAEVAMAIVDSHQNRGLGTELYKQLLQKAKENDIQTLTHYVLNENRHMMMLLKKFNGVFSQDLYGTTKVTITL